MKKVLEPTICLVLCLSLLLTSAVIANAQKNSPLSVWVMADCHYRPHSTLGPISEQNRLPDDPLFRHTTTTGQMPYESEAITNEFLNRFESSSSEILLVAGDLTDNGSLTEHLGISDKFKKFEEKTGKRIYVINGNHDIRKTVDERSIDLAEFKSMYSDFGYSEALACHDKSASYTADLEGEYRLIAIDAMVDGTKTSTIDAELLTWIEAQVKLANRDGKKLVGMIHYSILEHFKNQNLAVKYILVENYRNIASKFADWGIKYVFTGHVHGNDISGATSEKGNTVYDVETCSLIAYPNTYREVTFSDDSVVIESRNIDRIDTADLVAGYSDAQLELIRNDFQSYCYGYFKAGMSCFIDRYICSPESIAKALKIEKDTPAYNALSSVTTTLSDSLTLRIYDNDGTPEVDSVQEIAESVGEYIEPSDYRNLPDLVGAILASHYSGIENINFDSKEIRLFGQCFKAALTHALVNIPVNTSKILFEGLDLSGLGFAVDNKYYLPAAKLIFSKTIASSVIGAVIEPILRGFTSDAYAPEDLNVTLEGYGNSADLTGTGVIISNIRYFRDLLLRIISVLFNAAKGIASHKNLITVFSEHMGYTKIHVFLY